MHTSLKHTDYYYYYYYSTYAWVWHCVQCFQRTTADHTARSYSAHRVVSALGCAWEPNAELAPVRDGLPSAVQVVELFA